MRLKVGSTAAAMGLASAILIPTIVAAHVGVSSSALPSGRGVADATQELSFAVGHGCEGSDTYSIKIDMPAGVTGVRAMPNAFGKVTVQKDAALNVVSVTWTKADADIAPADENFYKLGIRLKVPNAPFTTLYFPTHQTCKKADGTVLPVVDWIGTSANEDHDAGAPEPAPALNVLPARKAGWNKVTVPVALSSLSPWFDDAQIVWKDTAAYSANPEVTAQIAGTAGVTALTALAAGDVIWVKY